MNNYFGYDIKKLHWHLTEDLIEKLQYKFVGYINDYQLRYNITSFIEVYLQDLIYQRIAPDCISNEVYVTTGQFDRCDVAFRGQLKREFEKLKKQLRYNFFKEKF